MILTVLTTITTTPIMRAKSNNLNSYKMEKVSFEDAKLYLDAFNQYIKIPSEYNFSSVNKVKVDGLAAYLFRFEKSENFNSAEHYSFIISEKDKQILGFTMMDKKYANANSISKKETEKTAKDFLLKLDPSLAKNLKNIWIEKHDEEIVINGKKTIVSGMKYKCYRASNNDYAWVIVGSNNSIITFERNIKWDNNKYERITEKWLHDNWLTQNGLNISLEKQALRKIVEETFANGALNQLNVEQMPRGFHPDFAILIPKENNLFRLPLTDWMKVVKAYKDSPEKRKSGIRDLEYTIEIMDITENTASVKTEFFRDKKRIITDYLSYIKFPDGWKAVAKVSSEHIPNPLQLNL